MQSEIRRHALFIGGEMREANTRPTLDVFNPAGGNVVATIVDAGDAEVHSAVAGARRALETGWCGSSQRERSDILRKMADGVRRHADELIDVEVSEVGRPVTEVRNVDIPETADCFDYYACASRVLRGDTIDLAGYFDFTVFEPMGVVAQIIPFNFPLNLASWKIAPALAMGNCVVLKPSEFTPSTAFELARIGMEAGLPAGVLNVVTGGSGTGKSLVEHPGVDMVAFTGGIRTGRLVAQAAGRLGKPVTLELGGKSANILFADCDFEAATASALEGAFFANGQNCCAGSRVLVENRIKSRVLEKLSELGRRLKVGMPDDPETQIGCLASESHFDKVLSYIRSTHEAGATIAIGGYRPDGDQFKDRPFLAPTILVDPPNDSRAVQEEIFGPVVVVTGFADEDEAVLAANGTEYDLAAGIWTNDVSRAHRVARRLRAGSVWINTFNRVFNDAPFGGCRWSGFGRDLGLESIKEYACIKNICICEKPGSDKWFEL